MITYVTAMGSYFDIIICIFRRHNKVKDIAFNVCWLNKVLHDSKIIYNRGLANIYKNVFTIININIKATIK